MRKTNQVKRQIKLPRKKGNKAKSVQLQRKKEQKEKSRKEKSRKEKSRKEKRN